MHAKRQQFLTFIIVGGGPTSIEFAAELFDFLKADVSRWYPELHPLIRILVVEASGSILGSFKKELAGYVQKLFSSRNVEVLTNLSVQEIKDDVAIFSNGKHIPFGLMVWSTGLKQVPLIESLPSEVARHRNHRVMVDDKLQILKTQDNNGDNIPYAPGSVFALGDCAGDQRVPLPALAQVI